MSVWKWHSTNISSFLFFFFSSASWTKKAINLFEFENKTKIKIYLLLTSSAFTPPPTETNDSLEMKKIRQLPYLIIILLLIIGPRGSLPATWWGRESPPPKKKPKNIYRLKWKVLISLELLLSIRLTNESNLTKTNWGVSPLSNGQRAVDQTIVKYTFSQPFRLSVTSLAHGLQWGRGT